MIDNKTGFTNKFKKIQIFSNMIDKYSQSLIENKLNNYEIPLDDLILLNDEKKYDSTPKTEKYNESVNIVNVDEINIEFKEKESEKDCKNKFLGNGILKSSPGTKNIFKNRLKNKLKKSPVLDFKLNDYNFENK